MFSFDADTSNMKGLVGMNPDPSAPSDADILKSFGVHQPRILGGSDAGLLPNLVSAAHDHIVMPLDMSVDQGNTRSETVAHTAASVDPLTGIALAKSKEELQQFASKPEFLTQMGVAFGKHFNVKTAENLADNWSHGLFNIPPIKVVSRADIKEANGAFAAETNTIYLSREFVAKNADNIEAIASVVLEETGHYIDSRINIRDAAGDEGAIFAGIVQGKQFDSAELQALKTEDDTAIAMLDGKPILIEQSYNSIVSSSPGFTKNVGGWTDNNNYPRLAGDVNGDGRADIVGFGSSNVFVSFGNSNGTFGTPISSSPGFTKNVGGWTDNNNYPRLLADVNGDKKADIIGFSSTNVFVSLSNGNGTFGALIASKPGFTKNVGGWTDNNNYPRLVGDVNGDGRADIVGFGPSDVFVSFGNSNGTFGTPITSKPSSTNAFTKNVGGWTDNNNYPRLLADVNGDKKADIIGFGGTNVFVSLSNGNGTFGAPIASKPGFTKNVGGWTDNNNYPRLAGDVNGDGRADIVGFGASDVFVSLANSNGTFGTPTAYKPSSTNAFTKNVGGWTDNNNYPRLLSDINADSKADIIGFSDTYVFASLAGSAPPTGSQPILTVQNPDYFRNRPQFYMEQGNGYAKYGYGSSLLGNNNWGQEGNCTWYAYGRLKELGFNPDDVMNGYPPASDWGSVLRNNARILGSGETPRLGDVAQWYLNGQNHVAIVEKVENGQVWLSESNWSTDKDGDKDGDTKLDDGTFHWIVTYSVSAPQRYIRLSKS
ncbi:CHAP domain-containing protein [Aerosakkonema funiforme]|uniref:CHAP domain-containing protein n=1 Tax=Aerosakkonema funiforme TaxID=1246630 RepID=UPI0035B79D48